METITKILRLTYINIKIPVRKLYRFINDKKDKFLAFQTITNILPYTKNSDSVLDIGCGNGYTTALLKRKTGMKVSGIDIIDCNNSEFEFQRFNGESIPFEDKKFDVSYYAYVLHHIVNPVELLKETLRVTKRTVIIMEDTPNNRMDWFFASVHNKSFNKLYNYTYAAVFRTKNEWEKIFLNLGIKKLTSISINRFARGPYYPVSRTLFILEL